MDLPSRAGVVIIGAGIGGLTAALSLHAAGIDAIVFEHVRELRPLGMGINLQPHAVRELIELGLGDELAATAIPTAEHVYVDRLGNQVFTEPRGRASGYHWPQYSIHRGELQMLLLKAVRERLGPDAVRTGIRLDDFEQTPSAVRARLSVQRPGPSTTLATVEVEADALIGADGLHSTVRALLHPDQGPLRWSGIRMWRGITEADSFLTGRSMIILSNERNAQFVAYPISRRVAHTGRSLINWVCLVPVSEPGPLDEDMRFHHVGRREDVLPYYADCKFSWFDVPGLIAGSPQILEYPMVDRDPLPAWGHGRVTLLGDAAHPGYPTGANGGSQAIIDARVLAYELVMADDTITGLASYENARREVTAAIVLANREMDRAGRSNARSDSLSAITERYRKATGGDVELLNSRPSLTPHRKQEISPRDDLRSTTRDKKVAMTTERAGLQVLQIGNGAWTAQAVYVAAKLGIADLLTEGPRTATALAAETKVDATALYRVLRALASIGVFRLREDDTFESTGLAEPLRSDAPDSVRAFVIMANEELYQVFGEFMYSVRTGKPAFDRRFGMSVFEYYESHPDAAAVFHRGMNDWHRWTTAAIVEAFDFSRFRKVVDVGGGNGMFLSALLARHPHLSGVLLDQAAGIKAAREGTGGPLPGCELVDGDFMVEVPPGADLYTLKHVINDWSDDDAVRILRNCVRVMAEGGRILVVESLIEPGDGSAFTKWLDLMLMAVTGGQERSESDFARLFAEAGLRLEQVLPTSEKISIVVGAAK